MSYLEELKKAVAAAFKDAEDKNSIDAQVAINSAVKKAEDEYAQLAAKNKELIAAYKDAVLHPGIIDKAPEDTTAMKMETIPDFADFVSQELNKQNIKEVIILWQN